MAEAIDMPFASTTRVGPGKHLLHIAFTVLCSFNTIQPSSLMIYLLLTACDPGVAIGQCLCQDNNNF